MTAAAPGLPGPVLAELAQLGVSVAERFGTPQDIEWAHDGERVWLLQARPLTALPPPPSRLSRIQRVTGPQVIEMLPIRPYPLDMSAWLLPELARMVGRMLGEIAGGRVSLADSLPESDGVVDRFVPPADWTRDPRFAEFERRRAAALRPRPRDAALGGAAPGAARGPRRPRPHHRPAGRPLPGAGLLRMRLLLTLLRRGGLWAQLVLGAPTRTQHANRGLAALASRVRADESLREASPPSAPTRRRTAGEGDGLGRTTVPAEAPVGEAHAVA